MLSEAWLRPTDQPGALRRRRWSRRSAPRASASTISSTWRTFASLRARLEPTGMRTLSCVKPWSVCGMNSLPTSGASAERADEARQARPAAPRARGVSVARRQARGCVAMRLPCGVERPAERRPRHAVAPAAEGPVDQPLVDRVQHVHHAVGGAHQLRRCPSSFFRRVAGGSFQTLDSIGSSVKLTNRLTSTATVDRDAEREEELADDAAHEGHRHEHGADARRSSPSPPGRSRRCLRARRAGGPCPCARGARCSRAPRSRRRSAGRCTGSAPSSS